MTDQQLVAAFSSTPVDIHVCDPSDPEGAGWYSVTALGTSLSVASPDTMEEIAKFDGKTLFSSWSEFIDAAGLDEHEITTRAYPYRDEP